MRWKKIRLPDHTFQSFTKHLQVLGFKVLVPFAPYERLRVVMYDMRSPHWNGGVPIMAYGAKREGYRFHPDLHNLLMSFLESTNA